MTESTWESIMTYRSAALFVACAGLAACSKAPPPADHYIATIRWTEYGVPHVRADDWGSLGYGVAYAIATDGVCTLAREFVNVRGEQSKFFGPDEGRREADVFHKSFITEQALEKSMARTPSEMQRLLDGYVAGYNRYLSDTQGEMRPASCRDQAWVRPIDRMDVARMNLGVAVRYGLGRAEAAIAQAAPPTVEVEGATSSATGEDVSAQGSNAIALGSTATKNGRGMLLGNPHYPWSGPSRFHMLHMTIPGQLDVMGSGLLTRQMISIGFNNDLAWSHTVSTALRYTLYELELDAANPLAYRYGNETRRMTPRTVTIEVRKLEGALTSEQHTVYDSHFGPVLEDPELPWTRERAYAIRDSNIDNNRALEQYFKIGRARSVAELLAALQSSQGVTWVNTIAADRNGKALYADLSVVPNVDADMIKACGSSAVKTWKQAPAVVLRATPECEWRSDKQAQQAGILPPQQLPHLIRDDYVTNSNDSHWLANPKQPLEGFSPIIGAERTARSLRTRAGLVMVEEVLGAKENNKFDSARLQELLFNHRNFGAELLLDDVLAICKSGPKSVGLEGDVVDVGRACEVLGAWDRRQTVTSRGAQIWTEFWPIAARIPNVWRTPFDAKDPVNTPRGINRSDAKVRTNVMIALGQAVKKLNDAQVPLDAPWGEVQYTERGGQKIGIPGGQGAAGMFSVISAPLTAGKGYTPIVTGNSWMQVVTWNDAGQVEAHGVLSYSQSEEADSPHAADQTQLYSRGEWLKLPFTENEIAADPQLRTLELRGN
jgi:acyl-homoserine-lactone acylase